MCREKWEMPSDLLCTYKNTQKLLTDCSGVFTGLEKQANMFFKRQMKLTRIFYFCSSKLYLIPRRLLVLRWIFLCDVTRDIYLDAERVGVKFFFFSKRTLQSFRIFKIFATRLPAARCHFPQSFLKVFNFGYGVEIVGSHEIGASQMSDFQSEAAPITDSIINGVSNVPRAILHSILTEYLDRNGS